MLNPTDEQAHAADCFQAGDHMALQAGAGTGKTTTLALLATVTKRRGRYLAFNKAIALDAARRFPSHVSCKTAHSLAYAAVGHRYQSRLGSARQPSWRTGSALGITKAMHIGDNHVSTKALSHAVLRTVTRFCHSADPAIASHHVPRLRGLERPDLHEQLAEAVLPFARKAWKDLQHPEQGSVRFEHDHYLKIWALTEPRIDADFLLLDEAQGTNPVLEQVVIAQRGHAQLVMVGDSAQAIYGWRGATDVMTHFDGTALALTQSFRFGPHLAEEANRWLAMAGAPIRLQGTETIPTRLAPVDTPDAILCRTNVGAMSRVLSHLQAGHRVALAGGGASLRSLSLAARDLKSGRPTSHAELFLFSSWGELQEYAAHDPSGADLQPFVDLIDTHTPDALLAEVGELVDESHAQVTVSTAHKAKGREWPTVQIADDFRPPKAAEEPDAQGRPVPGSIDYAEARLAYVAVTRARTCLDLGGLAWIDEHSDGTLS